jgi:CheY-like chemotaxis protein
MDFESQTILLVEDNPADVYIFKRFAQAAGIRNPLRLARTGKEAVDYLAGAGLYADRNQYPLPILIVLDLNLPIKSGLEVLEWMRAQPELNQLDVIALTSSPETRDVSRARELGVLCYLVKPPSAEDLQQIVEALRVRQSRPGYWPQISACLLSPE